MRFPVKPEGSAIPPSAGLSRGAGRRYCFGYHALFPRRCGGGQPVNPLAESKATITESAIVEELTRGVRAGDFARKYVDDVRAEFYERHLAGAGGLEIVHDFSVAMDCLLKAIFRYA